MTPREEHRRVAGLLPWYATGTLDRDERRAVEAHLAECATCRELVDVARRHADLGSSHGMPADLLEHVDPLLLVQYADDPESLEPWTREFVEERLAACEACRDALDRLRELPPLEEPVPGRAERPAGRLRRAFEQFAGAVLRPQLAAVYLALLVVALPALFIVRGPGTAGGGAAVLAPGRILSLEPETVLRDQAAGREPPVPLTREGGPVLVELMTELRPDDRGGLEGVRVGVRCGDRELPAGRLSLESLPVRDGRLVVPLVIEPARLGPGDACEIGVRAVAPGRLVDGRVIARRRLVIVATPGE